MSFRPLADRMRPDKLSDIAGQHHLVDKGKIIYELIASKQPVSLILWGPPGSGKTTLARIIANETNALFIELSAVTATKADITRVIAQAYEGQNLGQRTILFVDEIHRFSKSQQDTFLPHAESGTITLIGATTENPSFEVINPLLSRSKVLVLEPLSKSDVIAILKSVAKKEKLSAKRLPASSIELIAELSGGDARVALNTLELAMQLNKDVISPDTIINAAQKRLPGYDKKGENHYNIISAFIKSMRGSDANATLYYLARMLNAGEDPKFIARRMVIFASEDVGLAASATLNLAIATFQAVERIGLPECKYALFHCATVLAKTNKSRVITEAMNKAEIAANKYPDLPVPLTVRNAPTQLMSDLGYNKDYRWQAGFKPKSGFLPSEIININFFD